MLAACLAWWLGIAAQTRQAELWSGWVYVAMVASTVVAFCVLRPWRGPHPQGRAAVPGIAWRHVLVCACVFLLAFATTGGRAVWRVADHLPPRLEGQDLLLEGRVVGLPRRHEHGVRFVLEVSRAQALGVAVQVPRRVSLSWYEPRAWQPQGLAARPAPAEAIPRRVHLASSPNSAEAAEIGDDLETLGPSVRWPRAGEHWRMVARLRQPHGHVNAHGFDYELWLFERGIRATGSVRLTPSAKAALQLLAPPVWHDVHAWRERVRQRIEQRLGEAPARGVITALVIGDQAAIDAAGWDIFRATGTAHLVVISGLHVTLLAWLATGLGRWLWRRNVRCVQLLPAPVAARWIGLLAGVAYAVFSGWGIPAQRTAWMLLAWTILRSLSVAWPTVRILAVVATVVLLMDPWALLQPGFWLSFVAVALLFSTGSREVPSAQAIDASTATGLSNGPRDLSARAVCLRAVSRVSIRVRGTLVQGARAQWVTGLGLAPFTLLFFQQVSVIGFVANALAIPVVTLLMVPLSLSGMLLPWAWTWAGEVGAALVLALQWLAEWPFAVWFGQAASGPAVTAACVGVLCSLLPLPGQVRWLAVPLCLPMLWPATERPPHGRFDVTVLDVGQGGAVLVRTAQHSLLYDAGPAYGPQADAGGRVIVPFLRAWGVRPDRLVLSHRDTDHTGGAATVLATWPDVSLLTTLEPDHALRDGREHQHQACRAGLQWRWDGVSFKVLHPQGPVMGKPERANTVSCVLQVSSAHGRALLPGDIEREQELRLVAQHGDALAADLLVVPHHGSNTSSHPLFVAAVAPRLAAAQAGHRNNFGHPSQAVQERHLGMGVPLVATPECGGLHWRGPDQYTCWRLDAPRYWRRPLSK